MDLNMKGSGKLHQNITNYTAKDFSISNNATQSKAMLDKNSIGKKSLKEKVSLFNDVNFDSVLTGILVRIYVCFQR